MYIYIDICQDNIYIYIYIWYIIKLKHTHISIHMYLIYIYHIYIYVYTHVNALEAVVGAGPLFRIATGTPSLRTGAWYYEFGSFFWVSLE